MFGLKKIKHFQLVKLSNKMEFNFNLSNKTSLFLNLKSFFEFGKKNPFNFIPRTFLIGKKSLKNQYKNFVEYF